MERDAFARMASRLVVLDGGMGTSLLSEGMPRGACPPDWALHHPQVTKKILAGFAEAGSEIIYAPTFGANRALLSRYGREEQVRSLNVGLVRLARQAAPDVLLAGDLTTTGMDALCDPGAVRGIYEEQMEALLEAGVDLLVAETMISLPEALLCLEVARSLCALPVLLTVTVDPAGRLYSGERAPEAAALLSEAGADAVGINCSNGPEELRGLIREMAKDALVPVVAKPNAGLPKRGPMGTLVYDWEPAGFCRQMERLMEEGARLVGGCCGTTPRFIRELTKAVAGRRGWEYGENKE